MAVTPKELKEKLRYEEKVFMDSFEQKIDDELRKVFVDKKVSISISDYDYNMLSSTRVWNELLKRYNYWNIDKKSESHRNESMNTLTFSEKVDETYEARNDYPYSSYGK